MRLSDLKLVYRALQLYADDLGEPTNPNALIPVEWHERARMSDVELAKFDECDLEIFMLGEREEQLTLADRAPNADAFLQLLTYDLADLTMPLSDDTLKRRRGEHCCSGKPGRER